MLKIIKWLCMPKNDTFNIFIVYNQSQIFVPNSYFHVFQLLIVRITIYTERHPTTHNEWPNSIRIVAFELIWIYSIYFFLFCNPQENRIQIEFEQKSNKTTANEFSLLRAMNNNYIEDKVGFVDISDGGFYHHHRQNNQPSCCHRTWN
jgi:hypothetical protein